MERKVEQGNKSRKKESKREKNKGVKLTENENGKVGQEVR